MADRHVAKAAPGRRAGMVANCLPWLPGHSLFLGMRQTRRGRRVYFAGAPGQSGILAGGPPHESATLFAAHSRAFALIRGSLLSSSPHANHPAPVPQQNRMWRSCFTLGGGAYWIIG
jgi:hypothetical protein